MERMLFERAGLAVVFSLLEMIRLDDLGPFCGWFFENFSGIRDTLEEIAC